MNVILTGMMGAGKTAAGRKLAQVLKAPFADLDEEIARKTGYSIPEIFSLYGERRFRQLEREAVLGFSKKRDHVVSTGGKTLLDRRNWNVLSSSGVVITLLCKPETLLKRVKKQKGKRPLLSKGKDSAFFEIYRERESRYLSLPNKINTTHLKPEEVVEEISRLLKGQRISLAFPTQSGSSSVVLQRGITGETGTFLKQISREKKVFILSDKHVFALYGRTLLESFKTEGLDGHPFLLPQGEAQKNWNSVRKIHQWLLKEKATRDHLFVCLGGGVISDIGGFAAATFHRGMKLVNIPTTLCSQVDAGLGGKNGVNLSGGKNQVGTFYFPDAVIIDPLLLSTLELSQMCDGLVEALKAGIIADRGLFRTIQSQSQALLRKDIGKLEDVICRAAKVKLDVVARDPLEKDFRRVLNLGHTFGHALESQGGFGKLSHGTAVGMGMVCAAKLGVLLNLAREELLEEIRNALEFLPVPSIAKRGDPSRILPWMDWDKKRSSNGLAFIIPLKIGKVQIVKRVPKNLVYECLKEICHGKENSCD